LNREREAIPYSSMAFLFRKLSQPPDFIQLHIHPASQHVASPGLTTEGQYGDPGPLEPELCRILLMSFRESPFRNRLEKGWRGLDGVFLVAQSGDKGASHLVFPPHATSELSPFGFSKQFLLDTWCLEGSILRLADA